MGCAASKAPQKRDPVEELIEEAHAQQGRESGGGVTLDLSAAPASADAPAGKLCELGLSLKGKVPDAAWACVERLVVSGNPGLEGRERAKVDAFAATTTANGGWVRG